MAITQENDRHLCVKEVRSMNVNTPRYVAVPKKGPSCTEEEMTRYKKELAEMFKPKRS